MTAAHSAPTAGATPAWRPIAELTLTCDHRAVDGATGAGFLSTLRDLLQA